MVKQPILEKLSNEEIMAEYVMKDIIRYNNRIKGTYESVAEHSFFVTLFCLKILSKLNLPKNVERDVLIIAALHDCCESYSSDIPHDVKEKYPELNAMIEKIESDYYDEHWQKYNNEMKNPDHLSAMIVKLADTYSVLQWCINEKALGNVTDDVNDIYFKCQSRIEKYNNTVNEYLSHFQNEGEDQNA